MEKNNFQKIISKENKLIKLAKKLETKKFRKENNLFIIEGEKLINEAILSGIKIKHIFLKEELVFDFCEKIDEENIYSLPEHIIGFISTTTSPPPCMAIAEIFEHKKNISDCDFILILDDIQDPGNLGTIIRSAEATEVDLIICSKGTVDFFNPKVLRSSAGSCFRTSVLYMENIEEIIEEVEKNKFDIVLTSSYAKNDYFSINFNKKTALLIGNEGAGIKKEFIEKYTCVKIPMRGKVESLNVSIATSILLYEISRYTKK